MSDTEHKIGRRGALLGLGGLGLGTLALGTLAMPASAMADDSLARVRKSGVLRVGNGGSFPPFEFVADGKLTGFDIDLGNELGKRMDLKVDWQVFAFQGLIAALKSKRVDVLITAMTRTPDRARQMAFSTPYYKTGIAAGYRLPAVVSEPGDLTGKIVGVQAGTAGEKFVRDHYAKKVKALRTYDELPLALNDLHAGRIQAVVNTLPVLRYNIARMDAKDLRTSPAWVAHDVGINTRLADTSLLAEINRQVAAMQADGFLGRLNTKWFGAA